MSITIGSNIASLRGIRQLAKTSNELGSVYERLSSGQRINRASDDSAGLAIASSLDAKIRINNQAIRNLNDGISLINIAEGAYSQLASTMTRIMELAEQSANGVYSLKQRTLLDAEADALVAEYNRIIESTNFNNINLLEDSDLEIVLQGGVGVQNTLNVKLTGEVSTEVGAGTFEAGDIFTSGGGNGVRGPVLVDLNEDGILDYVLGHEFGDNFRFHLGQADGTFAAQTNNFMGNNPRDLEIADFNNDGHLDAATINGSSQDVTVRLGAGDGTFSGMVTYSIGGATASNGDGKMTSGDLNGDGILDIVATFYSSNNISILFGNADGTFNEGTTFSMSPVINQREPLVQDINGDGIGDLLVTNEDNSGGRGVSVFISNGDGTFQGRYDAGADHVNGASASDIDNNGTVDLVLWDSSVAAVQILSGNGDGTFAGVQTLALDARAGLRLYDMNGDGEEDIVALSPSALQVSMSNGDGTYGAASSIALSAALTKDTFAVGDVDGNGILDVVVSYTNGTAQIFNQETIKSNQISPFDLTTQASSRQSLDDAREILESISKQMGIIGAYQSRISVFKNNIEANISATSEAKDRIVSADIAQELSNLVRLQILQQTGAAILAQANLQPSLAISLLSG